METQVSFTICCHRLPHSLVSEGLGRSRQLPHLPLTEGQRHPEAQILLTCNDLLHSIPGSPPSLRAHGDSSPGEGGEAGAGHSLGLSRERAMPPSEPHAF